MIDSNKYIIKKDGNIDNKYGEKKENPIIENNTKNITNKHILIAIVSFCIVIVLIFIIYFSANKTESFSNNNMLEQQMFQEMTDENKQIYLELSEEGKHSMFKTWKKTKNL